MAYPHDPTQDPADDQRCTPAPWPLEQPCPLCGRTALPFDRRVSALLDWLGLLKATMKDVERAAEDLVA
jgi:hypothetical protein